MTSRKNGRPVAAATRNRPGPTAARQRLAAERAAAARARIAQAHRRRQLWVAGTAVFAIVAVVAVLIIAKVASDAGAPKSGTKASLADSAVVEKVTSVPPAVLNAIGAGTAKAGPISINGPALTQNGKPEVFFLGAEYCPYCAAERWAVAVALSRFGTLHGVGQTSSSPSDVYPSTATLTFHGATYSSSRLTFTPREINSNQVVNGQYAPLDKLTPAEQALATKYDGPPYVKSSGGIPFIDIGGEYIVSSASYSPQTLHGKTHIQIASALSDPNSTIAQAIDGTANLMTAALCHVTGEQPTTVCTSPGVRAAAAKLTKTD